MGINQRGLARPNWDLAISNGGIEEWFTGPTISNYHMIWACLKIKDVPKNCDFEGTPAESLAQRLQSRQPEEPEAGDGCYSQWHPEIL